MKNMVTFNKNKLLAIANALSWVYTASGYFGGPRSATKMKFHMDELNAPANDGFVTTGVDYYNTVTNNIKSTLKRINTVEVQWFCKDVMDKALEELKKLKVEYVD